MKFFKNNKDNIDIDFKGIWDEIKKTRNTLFKRVKPSNHAIPPEPRLTPPPYSKPKSSNSLPIPTLNPNSLGALGTLYPVTSGAQVIPTGTFINPTLYNARVNSNFWGDEDESPKIKPPIQAISEATEDDLNDFVDKMLGEDE
jgi:hypothetical protein